MTIPFGTLLSDVTGDPVWQDKVVVAPDVTQIAGVNMPIARHVAAETGDPVSWPFGTLAWVRDADLAAAALVFHGFVGAGAPVCMSAVIEGLPLTRRLILSVLSFVIDELQATDILARAPITDLARRDVLRRFGFRSLGPMSDGSLAYRLPLDNLPPRLARARQRCAS